jgi:hypothetical protein
MLFNDPHLFQINWSPFKAKYAYYRKRARQIREFCDKAEKAKHKIFQTRQVQVFLKVCLNKMTLQAKIANHLCDKQFI